MQLRAREIASLPHTELWKLESKTGIDKFSLVFDDGEIVTDARRTIYSAYMWGIHREYPNTPMLIRHHMGDTTVTGKTHLTILNAVYNDCLETYGIYNGAMPEPKAFEMMESLWELIYKIVNDLFNDCIQNLDAYVTSMNALDVIGIIDHKDIKKANASVKPNQASIDEIYNDITDTLINDPKLSKNEIVRATRSSVLSMQQVLQCIGPRGFVTEINSRIFSIPITVGYAHGFTKLYDAMVESRSASKSLMFAKDVLSDCEYFNRRLQLLAQTIVNFSLKDCGSTHYLKWKVETSELKALDGMNYVEEGVVKSISASDKHLVGKTINLRTVFGCTHLDRQTVCATCMGKIAYSIPAGTSPGHVAATSIGKVISQLVLSTKHLDTSSYADIIDIGDGYDMYLTVGSEGNNLILSPELNKISVKLVIKSDDARALLDVKKIQNLDEMDITRITEMADMKMIIGEGENIHEAYVPTSMGSRLGSLSTEMLYYIKEMGVDVDDSGNYVVDMKKWNRTTSVVVLPLKHTNMYDFMKTVEAALMIKRAENSITRYDSTNVVDALKSLSGLINSKITMNLTHTALVAYSLACLNPEMGDMRLPRGGESFVFGDYLTVMSFRSLGAKMAHEGQAAVFDTPDTYLVKDRPYHPMDHLLMG